MSLVSIHDVFFLEDFSQGQSHIPMLVEVVSRVDAEFVELVELKGLADPTGTSSIYGSNQPVFMLFIDRVIITAFIAAYFLLLILLRLLLSYSV